MTRRLACITAAIALASAPARATDLRHLLERVTFVTPPQFGRHLPRNNFGRPIATVLASTVARSLPTLAASAGLRYTLDPETLVFVRETQVNGQALLETAEVIGRGRWNLWLAYDRVDLDTFEGHHLDTLRDDHQLLLGVATAPRLRLALTSDQVALSATYGLTDRAEVNITVPLLRTRLSAGTRRIKLPPDGVGNFTSVDAGATATRVGVGDVLLRGKLEALRTRLGAIAGGITLRLPSGSENDFQGTGAFEVSPALYGSSALWQPAAAFTVRGYANAAVDLETDDVADSQARWGVGVDGGLGSHVTLGVSVIGRHAFARIAPRRFFDVPRLDPTNGSVVSAPLFGFSGDRPDYFDLAVGGRVVVWRDLLIAFAHVIVPLNRAGFRAEAIPIVGLEASF